jgi:hypothetical protein
VTRLGSRLTFGEAKEELEWLWGLAISKSSVRAITLRNGGIADELITEEVSRLEKEAPEPTKEPHQLVMSTDGALVQLTTGDWREVKTVAFGEFESEWDAKQNEVKVTTNHISYFSRVESSETFAQSALYEWHRRGGDRAQRVVAVNDGAVWIQGFIDYHCPQAIRVIDFAHATTYLATIGKAIHGPETVQFKQWYARMCRQLGQKPPQRTLTDLRFLQSQYQAHPDIADIETAIRYLERRQDMIDYLHFRKIEVPIGSGIVESGHKVVMQRRMKQAGMRWAEENLNPMLALRMALCNQVWQSNWQAIEARAKQKKRQHRLARIKKSKKHQQSTPVTEVDCQRLEVLAQRIKVKTKSKRGWQDHKWIFPHRQNLIHKN